MIKVTIGNNAGRTSTIIDETTTLRKALEDQGIDYTIGTTSLDGATLRAGDLDKTFADFGVTEKCYLMNVVKADNAAAIKVLGGVAVVESEYSLSVINTLKKYRPDSLKLFEGEGKNKEEVFVVTTGTGMGDINQYGAKYGANESAGGKATITITIPDGVQDKVKWIQDHVGVSILNLNKVEAQFAEAAEEIDKEIADIRANITVM